MLKKGLIEDEGLLFLIEDEGLDKDDYIYLELAFLLLYQSHCDCSSLDSVLSVPFVCPLGIFEHLLRASRDDLVAHIEEADNLSQFGCPMSVRIL